MIATSAPAPQMSLQDTEGDAVSLADHVGKDSVLVAVPDTLSEAAAWKEAEAIPFPVVVGTAGTPHEAAGLSVKVFGAMQQSGSMLVDRSGTVVHSHAATVPVLAYDRKGIDAALAVLGG